MMRTASALGLFLALTCMGAAAPPASTTDVNKRAIRHWLEDGDNGGHLEVADEVFAADVVMHHPLSPTPMHGTAPIKAGAQMLMATFEGYHGTIEDVIAEGDRVAVRWTVRGKQIASFMGIPASGKSLVLPGMSVYQFRNGRIVEGWYSVDMLSVMQQLSPSSAPPTP